VVSQHVEALRRLDAKLVGEWEAIEQGPVGRAADSYRLSTLRYGLARGRATLAWAEEALLELRRLKRKVPARGGR
jgi:hypothetical protein